MLWEAKIIEALQSLGNNVLDSIFFILTFMGDKLFFMAVASIIYWCFSKKFGIRFINIYLLSAVVNVILKSSFRRLRPFDTYDSIEAIKKKSDGWSFPSGHSNSIAVIGTQITKKAHKENSHFRIALILSIILTLTVMFTRLYLGQHYITDVLAGAGFGVLFAILFGFLYGFIEKKVLNFWVVVLPLSIISAFILILTNSADGSLIQGLGAYAAVCLGYYLEQKYINYNVKSGSFLKQTIKVIIGLSVTALIALGGEHLLGLIIRSGTTLEAIFTWYILYFLVGLWVMAGANYIFKKLKL